jgi:hypothetical protein
VNVEQRRRAVGWAFTLGLGALTWAVVFVLIARGL